MSTLGLESKCIRYSSEPNPPLIEIALYPSCPVPYRVKEQLPDL